nr:MAG TPA: hypothetical protein [Caudoviricetes sp.]
MGTFLRRPATASCWNASADLVYATRIYRRLLLSFQKEQGSRLAGAVCYRLYAD